MMRRTGNRAGHRAGNKAGNKAPKRRSRSHRKEQRGRSANKYRAYPTDEQFVLVKCFGGSCRFVKNLGKEQRDTAWRYADHSLS